MTQTRGYLGDNFKSYFDVRADLLKNCLFDLAELDGIDSKALRRDGELGHWRFISAIDNPDDAEPSNAVGRVQQGSKLTHHEFEVDLRDGYGQVSIVSR